MTNALLPEIILSDNNKRFFVKDVSNNFTLDAEEHPPVNIKSQFSSLFNTTSIIIFIGFLILYYIFYYGLGKFLGEATTTAILKTRAINLSTLLILIFGSVYFYYSLPEINQKHFFTYLMIIFKEEMNDPNMIGVMIMVLIFFYIFVWIMGFPMGKETKPFSIEIIEYKSWVYLLILIIVMFFIYVLNIEIVDYIYQKGYEWWNGVKDIVNPTKPSPVKAPVKASVQATPTSTPAAVVPDKKEVFNIGNNLYTYDDAQAICKSYDAKLATYDQVEESYNDGAEWCNYGWSEDQMILFPTQKSTWKELQKDSKKKHSCGRPGVNGGHMSNPYIKFGVNCYGKKPNPNSKSKAMFDSNKNISKTVSTSTEVADPAVEYWKTQQDNLRMNSYNKKEWSEFSNIQ